MVKIGLLSDTHGHLDDRILDYFKDVDEIWHAGDIGSMEVLDRLQAYKPCRIVFGNIDDHEIRRETKEFLSFEIEKMKISMTHIAGKPGKYVEPAHQFIEETKPDVFICGHSHILLVKHDPRYKMLWLNPGACGIKGFHPIRTMLRFQINNGKVEKMEAIELGRRA
ncbi:MAG: metallophosphatase family protein [Bacteroidetes bacterium]|nr:metallophosphatase family protein [Bacteroidota bacterium]